MYYIGLDVHKKTISYCVKDVRTPPKRASGGLRFPLTKTYMDHGCDNFGNESSRNL